MAFNGVDDLAKDNIMLCFQTEFQKDMMLKFCNNIACLDATHSYNNMLITIAVVDELLAGILVAWCLMKI